MSEMILPRRPAGRSVGHPESARQAMGQRGLALAVSAVPVHAAQRDSADEVAEMATGERSALERLYDRYAAVVYSLALRILGSAADAEEVVQEVFLQAWREAARFDAARGTPRTWLLTLA